MRNLHDSKPIWHAVVWILGYIVAVNIGDGLSELVGIPNSGTAPILLALSAALLLYVKRNTWLSYYGLRAPRKEDFTRTLFYAPLAIIVALQYTEGLRDDLDMTETLLIVTLMMCVGFIEELVFRGFLFRAILTKGTLTRAVVISGVTFGVGHIVNLARGYTGTEQIVQIGVGVALGIVLALLFAVTGTIVPIIVFHVLLNISGNVSAATAQSELTMLVATIAISALYAAYLVAILRRRGALLGALATTEKQLFTGA